LRECAIQPPARAQGGDEEAFACFFRAVQPVLLGYPRVIAAGKARAYGTTKAPANAKARGAATAHGGIQAHTNPTPHSTRCRTLSRLIQPVREVARLRALASATTVWSISHGTGSRWL
jgi:hypothetical protein